MVHGQNFHVLNASKILIERNGTLHRNLARTTKNEPKMQKS
jgi:hypothetical protein